MPEARPSVFIVDDHSFFRAGLRKVLTEHGFTVVGEAPDGQAALPLVERRRPDVVVMDLSMPGKCPGEVFELVRRDNGLADLKVCVITGRPELRKLIYDRSVRPPEGYLDKPVTEEHLLLNVRKVLELAHE